MRKWLYTAVAGLSLGLVALGAWLQYPPARYPGEVGEIVARHEARLKGNGQKDFFDDPIFSDSRTVSAVENMREFSRAAKGRNLHLSQLLDENDEKLNRTLAAFEPVFEQLHSSLSRYRSARPPGAGKLDVKKLLEALGAYCELRALQGRAEEARRVAADGLALAAIDDNQNVYLRKHSQELALQAVEACLRTKDEGEGDLTELAAALARHPLPADLPVRYLESTVYATTRPAAENGRWEKDVLPPEVQVLAQFPGLYERHMRVIQNQVITALHSYQQGNPLPDRSAESVGVRLNDWLRGETQAFRVSDWFHLKEVATRQGLDHLLVYARIYEVRKGTWPGSLPQLESVGYRPLPGFHPEVQWNDNTLAHPNPGLYMLWPSPWKNDGKALRFHWLTARR